MNYLYPNREGLDYVDLADLNLDTEESYDFRSGEMQLQERKIIHELIDNGYKVDGSWRDGERDSFGPLSRILVVTTPEDVRKIIVYG